MKIVSNHERHARHALAALAGCTLFVLGGGCSIESDGPAERFDSPRGADLGGDGAFVCETAFATGPGATCFIDLPVQSNNWGWSIAVSPGTAAYYPVYAGAGQCNLANGQLVGYVHVTYDGATLVVTVVPPLQDILQSVHLYVGPEPLPEGNNGQPTTAPGQYPVVDSTPDPSYAFPGLAGTVYLIFHAEVCGSTGADGGGTDGGSKDGGDEAEGGSTC
jgi:hypothetical protein